MFLAEAAEQARYTVPDYGLADNQLKLYQALSWVNIAVSIVSTTAAGTPFCVEKRIGEEQEAIENHPFELLLDNPNPLQSRFDLWEATFANRALAGNAYWWLNKTSSSAPPAEIFVLPSNKVKVVPGRQIGLVSHYEWDSGTGKPHDLSVDEVVHFKRYHPRNMFVGLSPTEALAMSAEKDLKAQKYDLNFFAENNAKAPGALAFKGIVPDDIWDKMGKAIARKHGGTRRELLRLMGAEDISWLQMGLTQKDMEFLEGRTFTKEEIFAAFAPGLSSGLAVNATEANSRAGKASLMEWAIWPAHQSISETITNKLLPLYGDNLRGQFDDVRLSDRSMELQEQAAFERSHTIDEIRKERYGDQPLGDERGDLLPAQVSPQSSIIVGQPPPMPAEPPRFLETGGEQGNDDETEGQVKAADRVIDVTPTTSPAQLLRDELQTWQRWASKRIKAGKGWREFETEHIPSTLKAAIEGALEVAQSTKDVSQVFADALTWEVWEGYP